MSVVRAPKKRDVLVAATIFGVSSSSRPGSRASDSKARCWLLVEPAEAGYAEDLAEPSGAGGNLPAPAAAGSALPAPPAPLAPLVGRLIVRAFAPGSRTAVELRDMGLVDEVEVRRGIGRSNATRWNIMLQTGEQITVVAAPCVCGAGRVGNAGPTDERHTVQYVRPEMLTWLTMV